MSGIPPSDAASALQAGLQQNTASSIQDNEHNRAANLARLAAQKAAQRENDVVGDENDMTVNTDGGGGGQGRSSSESSNETAEHGETAEGNAANGITTDDSGQTHIDLEA